MEHEATCRVVAGRMCAESLGPLALATYRCSNGITGWYDIVLSCARVVSSKGERRGA